MENNGWDDSAEAWIADMGAKGDFRAAMFLTRRCWPASRGRDFRTALDVGCGGGVLPDAGRRGIATIGIDPDRAAPGAARARDPQGNYLEGRAEACPADDASFDLVASYLTLIDIEGLCRQHRRNGAGAARRAAT